MKVFTNKTKTALAVAASLAVLTGGALTHPAHARRLAPPDSTLQAQVVRLGEVPGFWAVDCPMLLDTPAAWAQGGGTEAAALRSEGFVFGVRELVRSGDGDIGVSVALRFRSAVGAAADLHRREMLAGRIGYATNFSAPGSPTVRAYTVRTAGSTTVHVAFTRTTDEYAVAIRAASSTDIGALQRALATAVTRVAGRR